MTEDHPAPPGRAAASSDAARVAAIFDLDKTVLAKSSTLAFSKPFFQQGLINRRAVLKSTYAQFLFMLAGADDDQMDRMRSHITALCEGWDREQVRRLVEETLHDIVDPLVYAEATELMAEHAEAGHAVVIISASGEEIVEPIARMLGATHYAATRMELRDGTFTGRVEFSCFGSAKATVASDIAAEHGYDLTVSHAYSDSISDLELLQLVGHPTAVNPDRALRREAARRDWPVLTFARAVSLPARLPRPSAKTVGATAIGVGAATAAAVGVWYGVRRRH